MITVGAPVSGEVRALSETPDPVFAAGMLGGGVALIPDDGPQSALSPIDGRATKVMPHAFVISDGDRDVLVHLGLETVALRGEGFESLVDEGDEIRAGQPVTSWDPGEVASRGLSTWVLVCVLGTQAGDVAAIAGRRVAAGEPLFELG